MQSIHLINNKMFHNQIMNYISNIHLISRILEMNGMDNANYSIGMIWESIVKLKS